MYTAGKISTCPYWKITCPVGHITTNVYVPWDKFYMARACGHTLMSSTAKQYFYHQCVFVWLVYYYRWKDIVFHFVPYHTRYTPVSAEWWKAVLLDMTPWVISILICFFFLNTCFEKSFFFLQTGWLREKGRIWLNEITVVAEVDDDALGNGMMNAFQVRSGTWICNYTHYEMWDEITCPFPNFKGGAVEVWEWISYFIPHFTGHVITYYPYWDGSCWHFPIMFKYSVWGRLVLTWSKQILKIQNSVQFYLILHNVLAWKCIQLPCTNCETSCTGHILKMHIVSQLRNFT